MLNLSVIGTSGITEKFLSAARKTGRFKFHTVYSRTAEKGRAFAEKQGFGGRQLYRRCVYSLAELLPLCAKQAFFAKRKARFLRKAYCDKGGGI